jgi:hypothetical protein
MFADPEEKTILYEDDQFFTFNHPTDSTRAAVQTQDDLDDPTNSKYLNQIE